MELEEVLKRSWVEIDLKQIKKNYIKYREKINLEIMAVVKADAYGHGAVRISKILQDIGVSKFAVSNIQEAIELRESGIKGLILILGYTPIEQLENVVRYDITQTLLSEEYARDVIQSGIRVRCHYAIDTGMNRIGINAENIRECIFFIEEAKKYLDLTGLFTHLCVADTPEQAYFTQRQINKFNSIVNSVLHLRLSEIHCLNSAGGLWFNSNKSNFTRLGIVLYGLKPDYHNLLPNGIEAILEWKSVISMLKIVHRGETIGYGRTYTAEREMLVATIPTGYADGYNRKLSNKGYVLVKGKKAPIVGRICMDQFMIDVTDINNVKIYDEVVLLGKSGNEVITAEDIADMIDTINYEVVCNISKRVSRVYKI